jgi:hypothetical protein
VRVCGLFWIGFLAQALQASAWCGAQEPAVFLDVKTEQSQFFIGQECKVRLLVFVESKFLKEQMVQMFRQEVDLPVQVSWDWPTTFPGFISAESDAEEFTSFVLNGRIAGARKIASQSVGGRTYERFEILHSLLAEKSGDWVIPPVTLRYAFGTRFSEDLIQGRIAEDRQEGRVRSEPVHLRVVLLPASGPHPSFTGAIGRFAMKSELLPEKDLSLAPSSTSDLADQQFSLRLTIHGSGNLKSVVAPEWSASTGFHALGFVEDAAPFQSNSRTFLYTLVPLKSGMKEIPALEFCYFDPAPPAGYRTVFSESVELPSLTRASSPSNSALESIQAEESASTERGVAASGGTVDFVIYFMLLFPWLLLILILLRFLPPSRRPVWMQRLHSRYPRDFTVPGLPEAQVQLNSEFDPLTKYLSSALNISPAAVICPKLKERLCENGLEPELATKTLELHERLLAKRYGGPDCPELDEDLPALLRQLQAEWPPPKTIADRLNH